MDIPADMNPSAKALRLLSRANRMRILKDSLGDAGEGWIVRDMPKHFQRAYAMTVMGYHTSSRVSAYALARDLPATYDERKQMLQGHDDPMVWTGRLRQQVFEQARCDTTAIRGTGSDVRGTITFGHLAVGAPGNYVAVPDLVRDTLVGGVAGLPQVERAAISQDYRDNVVAQVEGITRPVKRLPPAPAAVLDRRTTLADQRASQYENAIVGRGAVAEFVHRRKLAQDVQRNLWRQMSGGSAPIGGLPSRTPEERRQAHNSASKLWYYRRRDRILARRRSRYAQLHSPHARAVRASLGITRRP